MPNFIFVSGDWKLWHDCSKRAREQANMDIVVGQLQRRYVEYTASLYREGYVDDQFTQLHRLQDESSPNFVAEIVSLFFDDSEKIINVVAKTLEQETVDFKLVEMHVHQMKGSSSSVGACRVKDLWVPFRNFCEAQNREGCLRCLLQVNCEYSLLKNKLQALISLQQQIVVAGGSIPMIDKWS